MEPIDPRWPQILSLSVHEFRTPMTVVAGYIRMLLKDRAGALNDQQRKLLEEAEKSCGRLTALIAEVSELSALEGGTATFNRQTTDLNAVVRSAVEQLPPPVDREVHLDLQLPDAAPITADSTKLAQAVGAVIAALRRELVTSDRLVVRVRRASHDGNVYYDILVAEQSAIDALESEPRDSATTFDEWRGGVGLSLINARRILAAHGGGLYAPAHGGKARARMVVGAR